MHFVKKMNYSTLLLPLTEDQDSSNNHENLTRDEYTKGVSKIIEALVSLGIMEYESDDLGESVNALIERIEKNEEVLFGQKLNKDQLQKELDETNMEIEEIKRKLNE